MTTRELNARERRIRKLLPRAQDALGLGGWHIELTLHPDAELPASVEHERRILGSYTADWALRRASIDLALGTAGDCDPPELVLIHELAHIVLHGTRDAFDRLRDQVAPPLFETVRELHCEREELAVRRLACAVVTGLNAYQED